jgi:predicted ATPase
MEVRVRNVGLLKDVSVELKGLTVIAGENDTGKSTLGKAIFVLQKSHMMSKGGFFYKNWRKYINYRIRDFKLLISSILETRALYDEIANILNSFQFNAESVLDSRLKEHERREQLRKYINELGTRLKKYPNIPVDEFISKLLRSTSVEFKNTFKKRNLQKLLEYQFYGDVISKYSPNEESLIEIKSLTGSISATIQGLNVESFKEEGSPIIKDVTFIDTPVIFQLVNLLSEEEIIPKEYTPTIKDLRRKIKDQKAKLLPWEEEEAEELIENIQKIINADIRQEWDGNFYMFRKSFGKSLKIRLENAATGIKSFSLLSILIQKGWIRNNTLLIVDEPEVHLHPIWQVKYAQILIELVRRGVYVLVSTHSPYMIQALEKFTKVEDLRDKTNFYLFSRTEEDPFTCSEEVSSEINKIYRLFVLPVKEILGW